jgi:hypothetical protein
MADLETRIEQVAAGPKRVSGDAGSVTQQDIDDLIKADRHLASKSATSGRTLKGIRFVKISPPAGI